MPEFALLLRSAFILRLRILLENNAVQIELVSRITLNLEAIDAKLRVVQAEIQALHSNMRCYTLFMKGGNHKGH